MNTTTGAAKPLKDGVKGRLREGKVDEAVQTVTCAFRPTPRAFAHGVRGQIFQRKCVWHDLPQGRSKRPGRGRRHPAIHWEHSLQARNEVYPSIPSDAGRTIGSPLYLPALCVEGVVCCRERLGIYG